MSVAQRIQFDAETHVYLLDGLIVPSVTQILKPLSEHEYAMVGADVMARAALLGKAVHKLIELDTHGNLDEDALDVALRPYLGQWRQFCATSGFECDASEQIVCSERYGYAGMLDLRGRLHGKRCIIDTKRTAVVPRTCGPQLAGYAIAAHELCGEEIERRFALHLTPERWRLVPFKDPIDQRVFLSALTLHQWEKAA